MSDKEILNQCGFYEEIEEGDGCLFDRYVKFGFSEMATKFEKNIFVVLLTSASCSLFSTNVLNF